MKKLLILLIFSALLIRCVSQKTFTHCNGPNNSCLCSQSIVIEDSSRAFYSRGCENHFISYSSLNVAYSKDTIFFTSVKYVDCIVIDKIVWAKPQANKIFPEIIAIDCPENQKRVFEVQIFETRRKNDKLIKIIDSVHKQGIAISKRNNKRYWSFGWINALFPSTQFKLSSNIYPQKIYVRSKWGHLNWTEGKFYAEFKMWLIPYDEKNYIDNNGKLWLK
jgi:hypothetical protein